MEQMLVPLDIKSRIFTIRGVQVILDRDLAELYGVETRRLNEQVRRNIERFPDGFMFQLSDVELADWKSQIATSNWKSQIATSNSFKMGLRHRPYAFTEHGVTMLASVLKSKTAAQVSIRVVKAFVAMRRFILLKLTTGSGRGHWISWRRSARALRRALSRRREATNSPTLTLRSSTSSIRR